MATDYFFAVDVNVGYSLFLRYKYHNVTHNLIENVEEKNNTISPGFTSAPWRSVSVSHASNNDLF